MMPTQKEGMSGMPVQKEGASSYHTYFAKFNYMCSYLHIPANAHRKRIRIHYSLYFGGPIEVYMKFGAVGFDPIYEQDDDCPDIRDEFEFIVFRHPENNSVLFEDINNAGYSCYKGPIDIIVVPTTSAHYLVVLSVLEFS